MTLRRKLAALAMMFAATAVAQDQGEWRAVSNTARNVTGDLLLGGSRLTLGFTTVPIAQIRPLQPEEANALGVEGGTGFLYKLSIRSDAKFQHKNHLCGEQDTQWMATVVSGKQLQVALFSSALAPKLSVEGLSGNGDLCGIFTYAR